MPWRRAFVLAMAHDVMVQSPGRGPRASLLNTRGRTVHPLSIGSRQQTCSYCVRLFKTHTEFSEHFEDCPVRISYGYIMHKSVRKAFELCRKKLKQARLDHYDVSLKLENLLNFRDSPEYLNGTQEFQDDVNNRIYEIRILDGQAHYTLEEAQQEMNVLTKYFGDPGGSDAKN